MNLKISRKDVYQILFTICVGLPYINNYEITFLVWFLVLVFTISQKYSIYVFKAVLPFLAILFVASFSTFFFDNSSYNIIRDITYILKPAIGILLGYQLYKNNKLSAINTIINAGMVIAFIHLVIIFYNAIAHKIINIHVLREYGGYFSDYEIYVLIILIFNKQFSLNYSWRKRNIFIFIIGLSSFLYVSRTNFIQLILFYLILKGFFTLNLRSIKILSVIFLIVCAGYSVIYNIHLSRNGKGLESFLYKIKNAPIEAFKTKINKDDYEDFNDNFRSFENIKTIKQVSQEGWFAVVFGKGLGSTVDVGRRMYTNDGTYVRHEAILHNAYITVFLKSGLIGVFFLVYSIFVLIKNPESTNPLITQINLLLFATGVFLIFENWVLLGVFLKTESKAVLIGYILAYREILNKHESKHKS